MLDTLQQLEEFALDFITAMATTLKLGDDDRAVIGEAWNTPTDGTRAPSQSKGNRRTLYTLTHVGDISEDGQDRVASRLLSFMRAHPRVGGHW